MKLKKNIFFLFVIAVFLLIISPQQFSDGMFMDGLFYATISRNLAEGMGTFWNLMFTETLYPVFNEHPPLAFGLQGLWFNVFGDHLFVERLYSLVTFVLTGYLMVKIWSKLLPENGKQTGWLPLLFWIFVPLVFWAVSNNMLENTMMIFTTLSVIFMLQSLTKKKVINLTLAGFCIFLAFLTKGFTGLFTLSLPFWIFIFTKEFKFKRFVIDTFLVLVGLMVPFLVIYLFIPEGEASLTRYFNKQVVSSIQHVQTVDSRFWIIGRLLSEYIPVLFLMVFAFLFTRKHTFKTPHKKWVFIFLALGLSGVLPIIVSMKQSGFYMLAAFPIISLALALWVQPRVQYLVEKIAIKKIGFQIFKYVTVGLFITAITLLLVNSQRIGRDLDRVSDVRAIAKIVGDHSIINMEKSLFQEWSLHGYFFRNNEISLDTHLEEKRQYILLRKTTDNQPFLQSYESIQLDLNFFQLLQKKEP